MVNTGRPSRACRSCLEKRIKCDGGKPVCRKCLKTKRLCGYRDLFEIKLRDETQSTIRKARAATQAKPIRHDSSEVVLLSSRTPSSGHSRAPPDSPGTVGSISLKILQAPPVPLADQAQCFFLANFVLAEPGEPTESNRGAFNFVLSFLRSPETMDPLVSSCWAAASMAVLAGRPNARAIAPRARAYYHTALSKLNKALNDSAKARENSSLLSVLLLSIYEGFGSGDDVAGWHNHMNGARALIRMRGVEHVSSTPEGHDMFVYVRAVMIRNYVLGSSETLSAAEFQWWSRHAAAGAQAGHAAMLMNMKTALLKAEAAAILAPGSSPARSVERALELYAKCKEIVTKLGCWLRSSPSKWQAVVLHPGDGRRGDGNEPPGGRIITFPNLWVAGKRVNCSASRILLAGIMVRCLRWVRDASSGRDDTLDYAEAIQIGKEEVDNIIASIPYFLNWTGDCATTPYFPCGNSTAPKGLAGLSCLWPLAIASLSEFATEDRREYVRRHLSSFSEATGSKHAEFFLRARADGPLP